MTVRYAAALAVLLPALATAQQPFRSGVDVVRVDALVTDGRIPIAGLVASDFGLRDNGVTQTVDVEALESLPLSLVLALDTSASVVGINLFNLRKAVDLILDGLHGDDRAALLTFSHRVRLQTPLTSDVAAVRKLMAGADASGGTALRDATYAALAISEPRESRALLLVCSDGLDTASWISAAEVERIAARANAVVYGVTVPASPGSDIGSLGRAPQYVKGQTDFLEAVASATGGRVLRADTTGTLPKAFAEVLREFRTRYVLTYTPRGVDAPGWHRIDVTVRRRGAQVRARAGYQR